MLISYTTTAFPGEYIPEVFDNYSANVLFEGNPINLQLWDTHSGEDYKKLRPLSYPNTDVFIIVFSLVNPKSLENVEKIWVPEIKEYCPNAAFILAGSDKELRDEFQQHQEEYKAKGWEPISQEEGMEMMRKVNANDYVEFSAAKEYHLKEVFESAIRCVLHPEQKKEVKKKHFFWKKPK